MPAESGQYPGHNQDEAGIDLLDEARVELERSTDDIRRLTDELRQQTSVVERLEMLTAEVLDLLPANAIVVDAEARLAAVSRGALSDRPEIARERLGEPISAVLPAQLAGDILAVLRGGTNGEHGVDHRSDGPQPTGGRRWTDVPNASVMALPQGWGLAVLHA